MTPYDDLLRAPFWYYIRQNKRSFFIGAAAVALTNVFDVLPPLLLARGIDQVVDKASKSELLVTCGLFFGVLVMTAVFRYAWRIYFGRFNHTASTHLRQILFEHMTKLSPRFFDQKPVGELMSLLIQDIQAFRMGIGPGLLILIDAVVLTVLVIPLMGSINWDWTWKTLILLPLVPFFMKLVTRLIFSRYKHEQQQFAELSGVAQEIVSGIRIIKSYAQEDFQTQKFDEKSKLFEIAATDTARVDALFRPVMEFGIASGGVILLYIGSNEVILGTVTLGSFVAFHRYIQKMVWPMTAIGMGVSQVQRARASFERIAEVLRTPAEIPLELGMSVTDFKSLEVKDLSFNYSSDGPKVLNQVSFSLSPGKSLGIVGPVGSGKSTLLKLLARMYEYNDGAILLNGQNLDLFAPEQVRRLFCLIPQEAFLFSDQVRSNIAFADGLDLQDQSQIENSARLADIHHEISEFPHGYLTTLGEKGLNLSGGQRQRMALARGFAAKASVLMVDDGLSAVDSRTEGRVLNNLATLQTQDQALIVVSHRLNIVRNCHQIIVLNNGAIEATGTHTELLNSSPTYSRLAQIQGYTA